MINRFRKLGLLFVLILIGGLSAVWALSPLITTASAGDTDEDGTSIATSSPQPTEASTLAGGLDPWTTVASAGTVDDADTAIVDLSGAFAQIRKTATLPAYLDIRYNIVSEEGLYGGDGYTFTARFRDNGSYSRVILYLKEFNMTTGSTITRMTLDSNAFPVSSTYQTRSVSTCWPGWSFNFNKNAYFIEAQIQKTNSSGSPGLGAIQIGYTLC